MDLMLMRLFQRQVADQCRFTLASIPIINRSVAAGNHDELWIACQMFVVGAANISKLLWGDGRSRPKVAPRRQPLRDSLGVPETSPLKHIDMRNHFEHIDQRLDEWWSKSPSHNHLDRMIGSPDMVVGLSNIDRFRVYDPSTLSIIFWGETFAVQPIATEVDRIHPVAVAEAGKPHWEPPSTSGSGQ